MSLIERTLKSLGLSSKEGDASSISSSDRRAKFSVVTGLPVDQVELYERAVTHASLVRHDQDSELRSNERLEFLGDAVLGMAAAEFLFERFPDKNEGFMTRMRAKLVNRKALAGYAESIRIQPLLEMSADMDRAGGRLNPSLLANAFEALLGAIYLDQGWPAARQFVLETMDQNVDLETLVQTRENYKSLLLEYVQARGRQQPQYRVVDEEGPGHQKKFLVEVLIGSKQYGTGQGRSKKSAEQRAARAALRKLEESQSSDSDSGSVALTG